MLVFLWCLLLVLAAPAGAEPPVASARPLLTLEEAVNTALQENRQVRNAALEVAKSEHQLAAVRTHRWPIFEVVVAEDWLLTPLVNFNAWGSSLACCPSPFPCPRPPARSRAGSPRPTWRV